MKIKLATVVILSLLTLAKANGSEYISEQMFSDFIESETGLNGNQLATLVIRRHYFIQRLTPVMSILAQAGKIPIDPKVILNQDGYNILDLNNFKNDQVRKSVVLIENNFKINSAKKPIEVKQGLKPLFMVWDDFVCFRSLEDQVFIEDFTKEIMLVSFALSQEFHKPPNDVFKSKVNSFKDKIKNNTADQNLKEIDLFSNQITHVLNKNSSSEKKSDSLEHDINLFVPLNNITFRNYINIRTEKICNLTRLAKDLSIPFSLLTPCTELSNQEVRSAVSEIKKDKNLNPLINLINASFDFKYFRKRDFERDYITALAWVHYNIYLTYENRSFTPSLKEKVDPLSIEDVLDRIDVLAKEIPAILEKYRSSPLVKIKKLVNECSWIPSIMVSGLTALLIKSYYRYSETE